MTAEKLYRISGHETFPCRYTWLPKAVRGLREKPKLFSNDEEEQAMVDLGLEPKVCHTYPVQRNSKRQEVGYLCQRCGTTLVRSRRLPLKRRYMHAGCGGTVKYAWTRQVMLEQHRA